MTQADPYCGIEHEMHPECGGLQQCPELETIEGGKVLITSGDTSLVDYSILRTSVDDAPGLLRTAVGMIGTVEPGSIQERVLDAQIAKSSMYYQETLLGGDPEARPDRDKADALFEVSKPYDDMPILEVLAELRRQLLERSKRREAHTTYTASLLARIVLLEELGL